MAYSVNYDCFYGNASFGAYIFGHELMHNFGAVQATAPRHDGANAYHPRDERDLMAYGTNTYSRCGISFGGVEDVDCGEDDYFGWRGTVVGSNYLSTHWNTGDCWNRFISFYDATGNYCQAEYNRSPSYYQR